MRVAFVHDWLVTYRGGEKVLEALLSLYPEAPVYTLFYNPEAMPPAIRRRDVRYPRWTSTVRRGRKLLLPLMPRMVEALPLKDFDLIISTSSCVAKGVIKGPKARHLCYLHSPMRYIWDQQEEYLAGVAHLPGAARAIRALTPRLRRWDVESAARVDRFVVNSSFVGERARRFYGRDAVVIHPPIETERFVPRSPTNARLGYLLAAGALVSYKRFDLAIAACEKLGRRLIVAGQGPMEAQLRRLAGSSTVFEIAPSDARFTELLAGAEALLFPGVEDFGMIAVEAMASGTPVIAYKEGGARDFIEPGRTGLYFDAPNADSLTAVLAAYDPAAFDAEILSRYAASYGRERFLARIKAEIQTLLGEAAA